MIHYSLLKTYSTVEDFDLKKKKLNEPGSQELGRYRSPVSRHSIQSYIPTYYRGLELREPGGPLISASAVPRCRLNFEYPRLVGRRLFQIG